MSREDNLIPGHRPGRGRPKGARTQRTLAIQSLATALLDDPGYRESLRQRLIDGKAPALEVLLHHYAYGKPVSRHEVTGGGAEGGACGVLIIKEKDPPPA